jgi:hypothetical protein
MYYGAFMTRIDSALDDIAHIRAQLAVSTRFQGFAPLIVALTGLLALLLAGYQTFRPEGFPLSFIIEWVVLAVICVALIGTEAIIRARHFHRAMADAMIGTAFRQFMPAGLAGAIAGIVLLSRKPELAWILPGLWQLLVAVGICASLINLPRQMLCAAGWYFLSGAFSLLLCAETASYSPWTMGLSFGFGQLLVAIILYLAAKDTENG